MEKTNVMRIFDKEGVDYTPFEYDNTITDGVSVAAALGEEVECVFKTLVTVGNDNKNYVFVIPVAEKLDLKKAARAAGVKNIEMIKQKELFPLSGYIHGGCSPIGMKKKFPTVIDETAVLFDYFYVSAGKVGKQVRVSPNDIVRLIDATFADLTFNS